MTTYLTEAQAVDLLTEVTSQGPASLDGQPIHIGVGPVSDTTWYPGTWVTPAGRRRTAAWTYDGTRPSGLYPLRARLSDDPAAPTIPAGSLRVR